MLECLVAERKHVEYVVGKDKQCPVLTHQQWAELGDLLEALAPIKDLTVTLCGQKYITMSLVQPLVRNLQATYKDLLSDAVLPSLKPLIRKLQTAVRARIPRDNNDQLKASPPNSRSSQCP